MKSFKALTLLALAATLSCGANGSPTNVTTDSFIRRQNKQELAHILTSEYIEDIRRAAFDTAKSSADFTVAMVGKLWDINNHYNYAICTIDRCDYAFDGKEGENWAHTHVVGYGSTSLDLVIGGAGTFTPKVGGDSNWAWRGAVIKGQNPNDRTIHFGDPGT